VLYAEYAPYTAAEMRGEPFEKVLMHAFELDPLDCQWFGDKPPPEIRNAIEHGNGAIIDINNI
jgi:hypothetical protein